MAQRRCTKCGRLLDDLQFYTSNNIERFPPDGKLPECKKCWTLQVDNWDPDTYKPLLEELDIPYFYFAKKPFKRGFLKAKNKMNLNEKNVAAVGDQIMTDVIGANRCNMFSILVEPINEKDIFITKVKRPIERCIMNRYFKKMQKEKEYLNRWKCQYCGDIKGI